MKKAMKKLMAALLAVAMVCAMAIPAWAAGGTTATAATGTNNSSSEDGKITIDNAVNGTEYKIYRILDLQLHQINATSSSYRYVTNDAWRTFVEGKTNYLTINSTSGDVTWKTGADIAEFAQLAGEYAKTNATAVAQATGNDGSVVFDHLPLGWYLVVSGLTTDSICSIDTTAKEVIIKEKNGESTIEKYVWENGATHGSYSNDASIGDTVKFTINVAVLDGKPKDYVIHDAMSAGLSFNKDSVKVTRYRPTAEGLAPYELKANEYTVKTTTTGCTHIDNCTFEVALVDSVLQANDVIMVEYTATINENAVIGSAGNPNETILEYNNKHTAKSTTKTYVWKMGVHKYTTTNENSDHALGNAEFRLYKKDGENIKYAKLTEISKGSATADAVYKLDKWSDAETDATKVLTPANGNIKFEGLDAGTYYLEETTAPMGYNKLDSAIEFTITHKNMPTNAASSDATCTVEYNSKTEDDGVIKVMNNRGTTLPGTGGIGTTIFYIVGGGLMVAAGVLLITKKRMENR